MKSGTLTYNLGLNGGGPVGMPSNIISFAIYVEAQGQPLSIFAGVGELQDPNNDTLYTSPKTLNDYFANRVRYQPTVGTSTMLVPNNPRVAIPVMPGPYTFSTFAATSMGVSTAFNAKVRMKLDDTGVLGAGKIPLHVFVTDLSGGCRSSFTAANASQALGGFEAEVQKIFAQASMGVGPITYMDSNAPSAITASSNGDSPELDALLKAATLGDSPDVLELVIIKTISGGGGNILGIAGGIPGSPGIPGTVHSGATIALSTWCFARDSGQQPDKIFGIVASHELGHTLGLFHNTEADMTNDAIPDTKDGDKSNLMYWEENSGELVTFSQGTVIKSNPAVVNQ
jgi:hypothetical protein